MTVLREPLLHPGERHGESRAGPLELAREFGHECAAHRRIGARHIGEYQDEPVGIGLRNFRHVIRPRVCDIPIGAAGRHALGDAAQILDERQPQHDGDRPQFTQAKRRGGLVRSEESPQVLRIESPVAVRGRLKGYIVHAGKARGRPCRQARKLAAVAFG